MAGGTGGHVFPALAVAKALLQSQQDVQVDWIGTRTGIESRVVPNNQIPIHMIPVKGLRGSGWKRWLSAPWQISRALWQAVILLRRLQPDCVLGMGGYVTGPVGVAAWLLHIPLVIHEQNAVAGLTNRWLSRLASKVLLGFPNELLRFSTARITGNPVRAELADMAEPAVRYTAHTGDMRLLVLGGSLGASVLNETVPQALARLDERLRPQVIHQAGQTHTEKTEQAYANAGIIAKVVPFIEDMAKAYAWADLVICRAGALTVSEISMVGLAALFVPYLYAVDDHQVKNAQYLCAAGAAVMVLQTELNAMNLADQLETLLSDRCRLMEMAIAARKTALPDATGLVVECMLEVSHG